MPPNNVFRLATCLFVLVAALQSEAVAQEKGKETSTTAPTKIGFHPNCIECPPPAFPSEARKAKIGSATVVLEITVSEKGSVSDIEVLSDPGHGFAKEAVTAVKHWKFKPAVANDGKKVSTRIKLEVVSRQM